MLQETKPRGLKGLDNDLLFDEVMKKSLVYSQKYNANLTKQSGQNRNQLIIADKRHNSSAKSDLSVKLFSLTKNKIEIFLPPDNTDWNSGRQRYFKLFYGHFKSSKSKGEKASWRLEYKDWAEKVFHQI